MNGKIGKTNIKDISKHINYFIIKCKRKATMAQLIFLLLDYLSELFCLFFLFGQQASFGGSWRIKHWWTQNDAAMPPSGSAPATHTAQHKILEDDGELAPGVPVILPKTPLGTDTWTHLCSFQESGEAKKQSEIGSIFQHSHTASLKDVWWLKPRVCLQYSWQYRVPQARGSHPLGLLRSWILVK